MKPRLIDSLYFFWLLLGLICIQCNNKQPDKEISQSNQTSGNQEISAEDISQSNQAPVLRYGLIDKQASQTLFQVEDKKVTVGQFADYLAKHLQKSNASLKIPQQRHLILEQTVRSKLFALEANQRGFTKATENEGKNMPPNDLEIFSQTELAGINNFIRDIITKNPPANSIPKAEVLKYYATISKEDFTDFSYPKSRRVISILLPTREEATSMLKRAHKATPEGFRELARRHNAGNKGSLGDEGVTDYFDIKGRQDSLKTPVIDIAIAKAAFELSKVDDLSPQPIETKSGFAIIKLVEIRDASFPSFEEAEKKIRVSLARKNYKDKLDKLEAELRQRYKVEVYPDLVDAIVLDTKPTGAKRDGRKET